jgi:GNAT superfamily N-acetyltransferase
MGDEIPAGQPQVHMVLARDSQERILGGIIFEFYRQSECWLATYIAVRPDVRHHGIGAALIAEAVDTISGGTPDVTLFAEAEIPTRISTPDQQNWAWKRIDILAALGMRRLLIDYVQPALSPEKKPIDTLYLLLYGGAHGQSHICSAKLIAFLKEVYAALHQPESPHLTKICDVLAGEPFVNTERLPTLEFHASTGPGA